MKAYRNRGKFGRSSGATILEYVLLAVGIAIFAAFAILKFGVAAQGKVSEATSVMGGTVAAQTSQTSAGSVAAQGAATASEGDSTSRQGTDFKRD